MGSKKIVFFRQIILVTILFSAIQLFANSSANRCAELFKQLKQQRSTNTPDVSSQNGGRKFLAREINQQNLKTVGFDIIDTSGILSDEQIKQFLELLPKIGLPRMNAGEFTPFDFRFAPVEQTGFSTLESLPPEMAQKIESFIAELTIEINRQLEATEKKYRFQYGVIRNYGRSDLVNDFHRHENGYLSATITPNGDSSHIALNPKDPKMDNIVVARKNQLAIMTDGQRARATGIPSTSHGSPPPVPGVQRLVFLLSFEWDIDYN